MKEKTSVFILAFLIFVIAFPLMACTERQKLDQPTTASHMRFKDAEYWAKIFEDPQRDAWQKPDEVVARLGLKPGDVVADIGAGTGYFTRRFAVAVSPGGEAMGLDIEPSLVNYMKEDAKKLSLDGYTARVVRTDDPELNPQSVNVIFLCNTYHHIENRIAYFRNAALGLKTKGRLVIVDFYKKKLPVGPPPDHKLSKDVVLAELKEAGYRLRESIDILPHQYFLVFELME